MTREPLEELGDRMLSYEPTDVQLGERYRQEIDVMLHRKPSPARRRWGIMVGGVCILVGAMCLALPFTQPSRFVAQPLFRQLYWSIGSLSVLAGMLVLIPAMRGVSTLRHRMLQNTWGLFLGGAFGVALFHAASQVSDQAAAAGLQEAGLLILGIIAVSLICVVVQHYHRMTELRLLQLEYRLADLASKIGK